MQITVNRKVATLIGATVVAFGGIYGAASIYNYNEAQKAKAEAEAQQAAAALAYANRPILDKDCTMNGYGAGSCSFTNTGKTAGAMCGRIVVNGPGTHTGSKFCSGMVEPMSTTKVEFSEPAVDKLCDPDYGQSWTDVCSFSFVKDGLGGGDTEAA